MEIENQKPKKDRKVLKAVLITILIGIVLLALAYFVIGQIQSSYQLGVTEGVQFFYNQIVNDVSRCQPYPIQIQNQTVNLILVECLQQGAGQ